MMLPSTIGPIEERNMPGACRLMLVPVEHISVFPAEVNGTLQAISLVPDTAWMEITGTKWSQEFVESWNLENGNQVSRATCALELPKDRPALLAGLWALKAQRHVVLHYDMNGTIKVMGSKSQPATVRVVKLEHGNDPRNSANRYALQVNVVRGSACPFYLATPPTAGVPPACPTLGQLLASSTWEEIHSLLSGAQLAAAEAAICTTPECPSLCQLVDDAFAAASIPTDALEVSGATQPGVVNGVYEREDTYNGKGRYRNGAAYSSWSGTAWWITYDDATGSFYSTDDTDHPWEATGWTAFGSFEEPLPDVAQARVPGGPPTALLNCLSPEQQTILADALGATCPSLCDMIDAALMGGGEGGGEDEGGLDDSFTVSGAGESIFNVRFTRWGSNMFKARYANGDLLTFWNGSAWVMLDQNDETLSWYQSTSDTTYPWEATGWAVMGTYATPVPTLAQDAADEPIDAVVVSGAGHAMANGTAHRDGSSNGRGRYVNGPIEIVWNGSRWWITDTDGGYYSDDDVEYPWEVTTWAALDWDEPLPLVAQLGTGGSGGGSSGPSFTAILDCLSPTNKALLAEELGELMPPSNITVRVYVDGDLTQTIPDVDPSVDNTINITIE